MIHYYTLISAFTPSSSLFANRIMLNETSYHGAGAIEEIATEAKARAFKKAFVCSDPDLIKFGDYFIIYNQSIHYI